MFAGRFVHVATHAVASPVSSTSPFNVIVLELPSEPAKVNVTWFGLIPSLFLSSSQAFVTDTEVFSISCLLVIVPPFTAYVSLFVPDTAVYPDGTGDSVTWYWASTPCLPASYLGKFLNVATQGAVSPDSFSPRFSSFTPSNSIVWLL